jgi:hypothetical protein
MGAIAVPHPATAGPVDAPRFNTQVVPAGSWLNGRGVAIYSNGSDPHYFCRDKPPPGWTKADCESTLPPGVDVGVKWQCVELVQRLYYTLGWDPAGTPSNWGVNAKDIWTKAGKLGFTTFSNGSLSASNVLPGDMVVWNANVGGGFGHVAVVDTVAGSAVEVKEQNWPGQLGHATYTLSGGFLSRNDFPGSQDDIDGVVHSPLNQPPQGSEWEARYPSGPLALVAMAMAPDGSRDFVTGQGTDGYATVAYNSVGEQLWAAKYPGPLHVGNATAVAAAPDGLSVYVTGQSEAINGHYDYASIAYDALTGKPVWAKRYNGPANSDDQATAIGISPDGSTVLVTGSSARPDGCTDYATVAYAASTGQQLWVKRYGFTGADCELASALTVSPDGYEVIVTGWFQLDYGTVAYRISDGKQLWAATYDGNYNNDRAVDLAMSPDGARVFVVGLSYDPGAVAYATVAYAAASGSQLWVARYDGGQNQTPKAVATSPDGSMVFVTGYSQGQGNDYDFATLAYDSGDGSTLWVRRDSSGLVNPTGLYLGEHHPIGVSPDGATVYITGITKDLESVNVDYATLAYATIDGGWIWTRTYNGPGNADDWPTALTVSPDGLSVLVTGVSWGGAGNDFATLAYDANQP